MTTKSTEQSSAWFRRSGIKAKAEIFTTLPSRKPVDPTLDDQRQRACDLLVIQEVLKNSDHLPTSALSTRLPITRRRERLLKTYPGLVVRWSRWKTSIRYLIARKTQLSKKSQCQICRNATQPFFTNLALMQQAVKVYSCIYCEMITWCLSIILQPLENGVVWANRLVCQESICILGNVVDGTLKELRLWNCYSALDEDGPYFDLMGQLWVEICSISQDSLFKFLPSGTIVSASADSATVTSRIKQWITDCDDGHSQCEAKFRPQLFFRLVQLDLDEIRLVDAPSDAKYATLSYCWGESLPFKTTTENITASRSSIDLTALPRTFRDFVAIARSLDIPYVWVDALCIIQNDPNDWEEQSTKMATIYTNAYLNISATSSADCDAGMISSRARLKESPMRTLGEPPRDLGEVWHALIDAKVGRSKIKSTLLMREVLNHSQYTTISDALSDDDAPLLKRAWAMQERLLSRRTVHFGKSELIWECNSGARCECERLDLFGAKADLVEDGLNYRTAFSSMTMPETGNTPGQVVSAWLRMTEVYSSRLLSLEKDRLKALSSLAQTLSAQKLGAYIAGLWSYNMIHGLSWTSIDSDACRPSSYRAPSWSWASIEGAVSYLSNHPTYAGVSPKYARRADEPITSTRATIKNITSKPASQDLYGDLNFAQLSISGPLSEAVLISNRSETEYRWTKGCSWILQRGELLLGFNPDVQSEFEKRVEDQPQQCVTLLLGQGGKPVDISFRALVLEKVNDQHNTFRRIGMMKGAKYEYPAYQNQEYDAEGITWDKWHERLVSTFKTWFDVPDSEVHII